MSFRFTILAVSAALFAAQATAADDCAEVRAATLAGVSRPYAATIRIEHADDLPTTSHVVMTGDKMYVEMHRVWNSTPMTTKQLIDKTNKSSLKDQLVCQRTGDETLDGVATTIYAVENQAPARAGHSRVWVAKANGLPMKTEVSLGGGDVMTSVFDYDNVQVPEGAR
jgi:outer membrane lipoprotein-sorting protein